MSAVEMIRGRGGEPINPAEYAYLLDEVNARIGRIAAEPDRPGRPFEDGDD